MEKIKIITSLILLSLFVIQCKPEAESINFKKLHPSKNLKIYDMRNIYSPIKIKSQGFQYFGIGR